MVKDIYQGVAEHLVFEQAASQEHRSTSLGGQLLEAHQRTLRFSSPGNSWSVDIEQVCDHVAGSRRGTGRRRLLAEHLDRGQRRCRIAESALGKVVVRFPF